MHKQNLILKYITLTKFFYWKHHLILSLPYNAGNRHSIRKENNIEPTPMFQGYFIMVLFGRL